MEIILVVVVLGLVAYWAYSVNKKRKQAESTVTEVPYKVESPVLATPVVAEPVKVEEVAPVVEAAPAKAKAPAKAQAPAKADPIDEPIKRPAKAAPTPVTKKDLDSVVKAWSDEE